MSMRTLLMALVLAVLAVPAAQAASTPVTFGAKLDIHTQPSNAGKGIFCNVSNQKPDCSWVLMQAYQCEFGSCKNGHLAPQDGTLASVSLIACFPGSFVLQIARADPKTNQGQVIQSGPLITYSGDSHHCRRNRFEIETFPVNVQVQQGDYLAVATQKARLRPLQRRRQQYSAVRPAAPRRRPGPDSQWRRRLLHAARGRIRARGSPVTRRAFPARTSSRSRPPRQ